MVEVLIAGGGPAGALAALILARAGVRVLVVDRARFPRDKLCGDTLNPGALRLLARHGLAEGIAARGLPIDGMLVTSGTGVRVRGLYGPSVNSLSAGAVGEADERDSRSAGVVGRSLIRREFDRLLIEAAVRAGAQFQDGVRVASPLLDDERAGRRVRGATLVTREGRRLRVPAAVTIAADGRRSSLAFALGLARTPAWPRRWAIGGYMTDVDGLDTVGEMHIRSGHYIGVAPLPGGLTNVCYVSPSRREMADPARVLVAHLAADPLLRDRMARARLAGPVTMLGPLAVDVPVAGMPGLLLAGDAAGFIDPMTGDGLRFALRGAELAADVARRMIDSPAVGETDEARLIDHARGGGRSDWPDRPDQRQAGARHEEDGFETLTAWRAREFSRKYRFNRSLRALVSSEYGVRAGTLGARVAPSVLRRIIRYAGDDGAATSSS